MTRSTTYLTQAEAFAALPPPWPDDLLPLIREAVTQSGRKLLVLDDDPTGTQTVYGIPVLTEWSVAALAAELREPGALAYVLTNSRSLPREGAIALTREIAANLRAALEIAPRPVEVISRSDSTLRGHFPTEIDVLRDGLALRPDCVLIAPCFFEGGRFTLNDVHYVAAPETGELIPAAETEYARDAYFGYTQSDLRAWVAEKYSQIGQAAPPASAIQAIPLAEARRAGPDFVADWLLRHEGYVIVNAVEYRDLEVIVLGLLRAERAGRAFMARTAASYVRVRAGLAPRGLLAREEMLSDTMGAARGGLVIAGSYIQKSTRQIDAARALPGVVSVEIDVNALLSPVHRAEQIGGALAAIEGALRAGQDAIAYTSRTLVAGGSKDESLNIGGSVSAALVEIVQRLDVRPRWLVAKGGITSSDVATKGLGIRRALVLGQIQPGVPVWRAGEESKYPHLPYVVFPGNVGDDTAIARAVTTLRGEAAQGEGKG